MTKYKKGIQFTIGSNDVNEVDEVDEVDIPIDHINYTIIELKTKKLPTKTTSKRVNSRHGLIDYEKQNSDNKKLGDRGELIVLKYEEDKLKSYGMSEFVNSIKHIAAKDDFAGYDIVSIDKYGNRIYIEVKSTTAKIGGVVNFFISKLELDRARGDMNYWIYVVFEAHTGFPKIWRLNNPFENYKDEIRIEPVKYRVSIGVE